MDFFSHRRAHPKTPPENCYEGQQIEEHRVFLFIQIGGSLGTIFCRQQICRGRVGADLGRRQSQHRISLGCANRG